MKLNPDCIRDILLLIESLLDLHHHYRIDEENASNLIVGYDANTILYHLKQCELNGLFHGTSVGAYYDYFTIYDLSPKGHELLCNIRSDTVWNKAKPAILKFGALSISGIAQVSSSVFTLMLQQHLGLT